MILRRQFLKADVGEARYAREPLRNRVRKRVPQGKEAKAAQCRRSEQRGAGSRVREGREPRVGEPVGFCDANFQKADVGETRYAREPLRNRVRRAKQRKQRNLVGPKQRGAGGRVREGREPRVGEPVGFCDANFQKADVGETRYAREPLRNRVRRAKQRKQPESVR